MHRVRSTKLQKLKKEYSTNMKENKIRQYRYKMKEIKKGPYKHRSRWKAVQNSEVV